MSDLPPGYLPYATARLSALLSMAACVPEQALDASLSFSFWAFVRRLILLLGFSPIDEHGHPQAVISQGQRVLLIAYMSLDAMSNLLIPTLIR
jgi:hypothetical protein